MWKRLQHPNVVPCLGAYAGRPPQLGIISSWMENGTITQYVRKYHQVDRVGLVSELASTAPSHFKNWILQLWDVANGLHYLHSCEIIHGDLKGVSLVLFLQLYGTRSLTSVNPKANILVDENGHARLTDFGLTAITRGDNSIRSPANPAVASTTWAAPEVLEGRPETKEGDVFTFAMVSVEVRTSRILASTSQANYLE